MLHKDWNHDFAKGKYLFKIQKEFQRKEIS